MKKVTVLRRAQWHDADIAHGRPHRPINPNVMTLARLASQPRLFVLGSGDDVA